MLSALGAMACSVLLAIRIHGLSLREVARSSRLIVLASAPILVVYFAIGRTMPVVAALATLLALAMAGLLLIRSLRKELASGNRMSGHDRRMGH
jgi:hypothetical protein